MRTFDTVTERSITLAQAATYLPRRADGRKLCVRTIERWIRVGHRGVKLEGAYWGKSLCTSVEALRRFSAALSGEGPATQSPAPAAARYLAEQGFNVPGFQQEAVA